MTKCHENTPWHISLLVKHIYGDTGCWAPFIRHVETNIDSEPIKANSIVFITVQL